MPVSITLTSNTDPYPYSSQNEVFLSDLPIGTFLQGDDGKFYILTAATLYRGGKEKLDKGLFCLNTGYDCWHKEESEASNSLCKPIRFKSLNGYLITIKV